MRALPHARVQCPVRYGLAHLPRPPGWCAPQDGTSVRVMAGTSGGVTGPIKMQHPGMLLDVRLSPGASWSEHVPTEWNGMAYVSEPCYRCGL